ncbi:MAG: hypothetical protein J6J13_01365 [Clostridia bacterium]|nr:hypothetical protein [Clostridia bacterium]
MIANSKTVKSIVKNTVSGKLTRCIIACLIPLFCGIILALVLGLLASATPKVVSLILSGLSYMFILFPLIIGLLRFLVRLYLNNIQEDVICVFHYFSSIQRYKRALSLQASLLIRRLLIALVIALPIFGVWLISNPLIYNQFDFLMPVWAQSLSYAVNILEIIGIFIYLLITLRYYLAPFLFVADEEMDSSEAVYMSRLISKRTVIDFVFLIFSYIPHIVLTLFLVPAIFTLPYLVLAYVVHSDSAVVQYNSTVNTINCDGEFSVEGL